MSSLAKGLEGSFSNVKYNQIAPFVGLDPSEHLQDAPTLTMQRARIPDFFFRKIVMDIDGIMMQYGPPMNHKNAEVRYRTLAPASIYIPLTMTVKIIILNLFCSFSIELPLFFII